MISVWQIVSCQDFFVAAFLWLFAGFLSIYAMFISSIFLWLMIFIDPFFCQLGLHVCQWPTIDRRIFSVIFRASGNHIRAESLALKNPVPCKAASNVAIFPHHFYLGSILPMFVLLFALFECGDFSLDSACFYISIFSLVYGFFSWMLSVASARVLSAVCKIGLE